MGKFIKSVKKAAKDSLYVASAIAIGEAFKDWLITNHKNYAIDIIETIEVNGIGAFLIDPRLPPVVVCAHGALFQLAKYDYTRLDKRYRILTGLEKKALLNADLVVTHSPSYQRLLAEEFKIAIDFATAPWQTGSEPENHHMRFELLIIGRLQACKGVMVIVEALQKSVNEGREIKIVWIGRDTHTAPNGALWSTFLQRKYASIWQKNLIWIPEMKKHAIRDIIASAGIVIIPSIWESFGYASIEAASAGKPVIISEGAGSAYLFKETANATIFPINDSGALLEAIQYHLTNLSGQIHPGYNNKDLISKKLSPELVLAERIKSYKTAINKRLHRPDFKGNENHIMKEVPDLSLPVSHYFKKIILKILARI